MSLDQKKQIKMIPKTDAMRTDRIVTAVISILLVSGPLASHGSSLATGSGKIHSHLANEVDNTIAEDTSMLGLLNMFGGGNPRITPEGEKLIEGDIVSPSGDLPSPRKGVPDTSLYWPNGEIVYTYHESINQMEMSVIEAAIQHWRQHTCLTFRQRQANDYYFIRFRSDTQGCWSLVGRQADRMGQGQDVSIGQGCANLNVVVHEIGHVIGFYHEQSRSDRDQYIDIVWSNVLPGYALQFRKESDSSYNIPYDLTSTMQYPQWAFSKEIFEKSTIVARNPAYQRFLNKNYPLSFRDRLLANQMYQCTAACSSSGASCLNGGYMRSAGASATGYGYGGSQCGCDCPPNFTGPNCETQLRSDYYDELPCGGIMTKAGRIQTPGYPQRSAPGQSCMWDIRAPAGSIVSLQFDGFEFAPRFTKPGTKVINKCFNETVEIRLKSGNIYDGDTYCGTDLTQGTVLRSDGPRAVIIITANDKMYGSGLSARVKFVNSMGQVDEGDDKEDNNEIKDNQNGQRPQPQTPQPTQPTPPSTTVEPPVTAPGVFTVPPRVIGSTMLPIIPPQPPTVVTTSSLLEEYEKESKKTLPPVFPFAN